MSISDKYYVRWERMRLVICVSVSLLLLSCSSAPPAKPTAARTPAKVKITQFYAEDKKVPRGLKGNLCYGVENASRLTLDPPSEEVWPALTRCFEVSPTKNTTYTLTAFGADGSVDKKTADVRIAAAPPRLYDLIVNKIDVKQGETVQICFKTENTRDVKTSAGRLNKQSNCILDNPRKTTAYKITALGGDNEMDSGTITVKVH